jgi:hypothetical protein
MIMRPIIAAAVLALVPSLAMAQAEKKDPGSLSNKQMEQQPTNSGTTAAPTAKPEEGKGSLSDKAMKDGPASTGGSTGEPTAQPKGSDLPGKAENDLGKK